MFSIYEKGRQRFGLRMKEIRQHNHLPRKEEERIRETIY